jgi:hypothetical protein
MTNDIQCLIERIGGDFSIVACGFKTQQHFARVFSLMCRANTSAFERSRWRGGRFAC